MSNELVVASNEVVPASVFDALLSRIRPEWRARKLIERVERLMAVDPSSACQRLLNAAIHDLRGKILTAGIDVAKEAAVRFKLSPVAKPEDISENYSTTNVIDLAYRMGILSRGEFKRVRRAYDIRGDLEHEDDEYEAQVEDVVYIFRSCIEHVLAVEPFEILRVADVAELVDRPEPAVPSKEFLHDFEKAPEPRQQQIIETLVHRALDSGEADVIRQNAVELLRHFRGLAKQSVLIEAAAQLQERVSKKGRLDLVVAKVAHAAGLLPYLKERQRADLFEHLYSKLAKIGPHWKKYAEHGDPLDEIEDVGGLTACPASVRGKMVKWMVECFIGEPGGYGDWGRMRPVFYSNSASPRIEKMFQAAKGVIDADFAAAEKERSVRAAISDKHVARRLEDLRDLLGEDDDED